MGSTIFLKFPYLIINTSRISSPDFNFISYHYSRPGRGGYLCLSLGAPCRVPFQCVPSVPRSILTKPPIFLFLCPSWSFLTHSGYGGASRSSFSFKPVWYSSLSCHHSPGAIVESRRGHLWIFEGSA